MIVQKKKRLRYIFSFVSRNTNIDDGKKCKAPKMEKDFDALWAAV